MEKRKRKKTIFVFIFTSLNLVNLKVYTPGNLEYKALALSLVNLKVYTPKSLYRNHAEKFQNSSGAVLELMFFTARDEDHIPFPKRYFLVFPQERSFAFFDEDLMLPFVGMIRGISAGFKLKYA